MRGRRSATALKAARGAVGLLMVAGAPLLAGAGGWTGVARAATPSPSAMRAVRYLEGAQNRDGGLGQAPGQPSAQLFAGWAGLGLASAGVRLDTLRSAPARPSLLAYVRRDARSHDPGSLERTILVLRAAGDAAGARALVPALVGRFSAHAAVAGQVNLTAFGVLALRSADVRSTRALQARAARWLAREGDGDGGYGFDGRGGQSEADDTGAVLEALGAGGGPALARARRRAVAYLRHDQDRDGGFPSGPGAGSNAQSTAWAIQGLIAAGVAPGSLRRGGHTPLGYLESLVGQGGAVAYARGESQTPVWVTGEALMALTGTPLPLAGAAPSTSRPGTATATSTSTSTTATTSSVTAPATTTAATPTTAAPSTTARSEPSPPRCPATRVVARMEAAVSALPGRILASTRLGP